MVAGSIPAWAGPTLTQDGQPAATIVVPKAALAPAKDDTAAQKAATAAAEFQQYIAKISGAKLPIVGDDTEPKGALILVGRSKLADAMGIAIPSGVTPKCREEGFVIAARGDKLLLAGNDAGNYHGSEYAVDHFLDKLGVRWFLPTEFGEVVPHQATIRVDDMEEHQVPDFFMRDWWGYTAPDLVPQIRRWKIRNLMNPDAGLAIPGDGSVRDFCADPALAKTQPELFARNMDGSVNTDLPNLTNPKAVAIAAAKMEAVLRAHPGQTSIGLAPDDGMPRDYNPATAARNLGLVDLYGREGNPRDVGTTEEWLDFVNAVAARVGQDFPHVIITTNGYASRNYPPEGVRPAPNLGIMFAAIWSDTLHAFDDPKSWQTVRQGQMLRQWCRLNKRVFMYNYLETMMASVLTPVPQVRKLTRNFPLIKKWGVFGFKDEGRYAWMEQGIATWYVRAKLEWNANANVKAILDDYYEKWYGPAAKPARAFWDALENAIESTPMLGHEDRILPFVYSAKLVSRLDKTIAEAEAKATQEPFKTRVHADRLILEHMRAYMAMQDAEFAADFPEAVRQADRMADCRRRIAAICEALCVSNGNPQQAGEGYWGLADRRAYYVKLDDETSGKTGDLVAVLPDKAAFTTDPYDKGRFEDWQRAGFVPQGWKTVSTVRPFFLNDGLMNDEGFCYVGILWYRMEVDVPAKFAGRTVKLYIPTVESEAWAWVNGEFVGHRPYHDAYERPNEFEADVTKALRPGQKNVVMLRVSTSSARAAVPDGLLSRGFFYAPIEQAAAPKP